MREFHRLPLTLKGVGGRRYINLPGLIYPDKVLHVREGMDSRDGKPYREIPEWGISTKEVSKMLGYTYAATRAYLRRFEVEFRIVAMPGGHRRMYWRRSQVDHLMEMRLNTLSYIPKKFMPAEEARQVLGVSRSSLYRYTKRGFLRAFHIRYRDRRGIREKICYLRSQVRKLTGYLAARNSIISASTVLIRSNYNKSYGRAGHERETVQDESPLKT